jgi:hypothetical protein
MSRQVYASEDRKFIQGNGVGIRTKKACEEGLRLCVFASLTYRKTNATSFLMDVKLLSTQLTHSRLRVKYNFVEKNILSVFYREWSSMCLESSITLLR